MAPQFPYLDVASNGDGGKIIGVASSGSFATEKDDGVPATHCTFATYVDNARRWQKTLRDCSQFFGGALDASNNLYVVVATSTGTTLRKYDSDGNLVRKADLLAGLGYYFVLSGGVPYVITVYYPQIWEFDPQTLQIVQSSELPSDFPTQAIYATNAGPVVWLTDGLYWINPVTLESQSTSQTFAALEAVDTDGDVYVLYVKKKTSDCMIGKLEPGSTQPEWSYDVGSCGDNYTSSVTPRGGLVVTDNTQGVMTWIDTNGALGWSTSTVPQTLYPPDLTVDHVLVDDSGTIRVIYPRPANSSDQGACGSASTVDSVWAVDEYSASGSFMDHTEPFGPECQDTSVGVGYYLGTCCNIIGGYMVGWVPFYDDSGALNYYLADIPLGDASTQYPESQLNRTMPQDTVSVGATPSTQTVGKAIELVATLTSSSGVPIADQLLTFGVTSGPDAGKFAAIVRTDSNGVATAKLRGSAVGTDTTVAWLDNNGNGQVDSGEPVGTALVTWQPREAVLFIQGIGSTSTCPDSSDFVGRVAWMRSALSGLLAPGVDYLYYAYQSPHTASPTCADSSDPQYTKADTCWSIDDSYGNEGIVPGGGEAERLSSFLTSHLEANPGETISIVAHSQGGVLAAYTVKDVLPNAYARRIRSIVTLDSPLRGINSIAPYALDVAAHCPTSNQKYDSPADMAPGSQVIRRINDATEPAVTKLYTVDADPGRGFGVKFVDDAHSTTSCRTPTSWCASAHIQIASKTHGDIWDGCFPGSDGLVVCANVDGSGLAAPGIELTRFTACAIDSLSTDCTAYSESAAPRTISR